MAKSPILQAKNLTPYVINADAALLPRWTAQLDKVRDGIADAVIVCDGDSTTFGYGGLPSGSGASRSAHTYPVHLASILAAKTGLATSGQGIIGFRTGLTNTNITDYDSRIALRGTLNPGVNSVGGSSAVWNATGGIDFTPVGSFNTAELVVVSNGAAFSWGVDGGSATTVTTSSAFTVDKHTLSLGTLSAHTLNVNWVSGQFYIISLSFYDSTKKQIRVLNGGASGAVVGTNVGNSAHWDPFKVLSEGALGQHLVVDMWGINDWNAGTSITTFGSTLANRIAAAKTYSDYILVSGAPSDPSSSASLATQAAYVAEMRRQALIANVPFIDTWSRFGGGWSTGNANGLYKDAKHPSGPGYSNIARAVARILTSL